MNRRRLLRQKFKVLKGGLETPPHIAEMTFISGYVTDTRFMGVVGLYIHWSTISSDTLEESDLHQFFYYEAEEFGLEEYQSIKGNDLYAISRTRASLFGGLGGKQIEITEKEAYFFVQNFANFNQKRNIPLPGNRDEYFFMLSKEQDFTPKDRGIATRKMCTPIENNYQAVHYFLMRIFGKDFIGAGYLSKGTVFFGHYEELPLATLCLNTLTPQKSFEQNDSTDDIHVYKSFLAESVLDCDDHYYLVVSEVTLDWDYKVVSFTRHSAFKISSAEVSMMLKRSEYMTIYEMMSPGSRFETECSHITDKAMSSLHDCGKLYMLLNDNNNHVKKRVFRLNDDVLGMYYVSHFGQIIAAAYSLEAIHYLEQQIRKSTLYSSLMITAKYEFKEPLLYEFINSGFEDFDDFLDLVKDENEDD